MHDSMRLLLTKAMPGSVLSWEGGVNKVCMSDVYILDSINKFCGLRLITGGRVGVFFFTQ